MSVRPGLLLLEGGPMRVRWWEIVVIAVLLALVGVFLWPARVNGPPGQWAHCMSNIRQVGVAMLIYAEEHNGSYPESFGVLLKAGPFLSPRTFICPASGNKVPEDFPKEGLQDADLSVLIRVDAWSDYVIVKGLSHAGREDIIVLYEKPGHHRASGRNCFFDDGHVEWLSEAEFQAQMRRQRPKGANP